MRRPLPPLLPVVAAGVAAAGLVGCATQRPTVEERRLEEHASERLADMAGVAPDDVDCPGDLEGAVGTTMRCVLTAGGDRLGVTIEVTEVEGEQVRFDIEVDEEMVQ